jgi:hypothetical protein
MARFTGKIFADQGGNGDFYLAGNSPLLCFRPDGYGNTTDLDGNTRPTPGKTDFGAYHETIFTDGFEP